MARTLSRNDIPILVLAVLCDGPSHGYAIAREVERRSQALFQMKEGALYPALKVLETDELVEGKWEIQGSGPARKVYKITAAGQAELDKRAREWACYREAINAFVPGASHASTT